MPTSHKIRGTDEHRTTWAPMAARVMLQNDRYLGVHRNHLRIFAMRLVIRASLRRSANRIALDSGNPVIPSDSADLKRD